MPDKKNAKPQATSSTPVTPQSPQTQWANHGHPIAPMPPQPPGEWQHPSWHIPQQEKQLVVTESYKNRYEEIYDLELDLIIGKEINVLERELTPQETEENLHLAFQKMYTQIDDAIAQGKAKLRERKPPIIMAPLLTHPEPTEGATPFMWDFWNTPVHPLTEPDVYTDTRKYRDLFKGLPAIPVKPPVREISTKEAEKIAKYIRSLPAESEIPADVTASGVKSSDSPPQATTGAPGSFTNWYAGNGNKYPNRIEAYRAWQSYPLEIPGESTFDRHMRMAAAAAWDSKSDMAGSMSFGGFGSAIEIEEGISAWTLAPSPRGFAIEKVLGGNLPPGFPTIDRFIDGEVASIKSIDLTAPSYQNPSALRSKLNGFIRKIEKFERGEIKKIVIKKGDYKSKALVIAIQKGVANHEQMLILKEAIQTAASKSVNLTISQIK